MASIAEDCIICLQAISDSLLSSIDGCPHQFCFPCISQWAKVTNLCPVCKSEFNKIVAKRTPNKTDSKLGIFKKKEIKVRKRTQQVDYEETGMAIADGFVDPNPTSRRNAQRHRNREEFILDLDEEEEQYFADTFTQQSSLQQRLLDRVYSLMNAQTYSRGSRSHSRRRNNSRELFGSFVSPNEDIPEWSLEDEEYYEDDDFRDVPQPVPVSNIMTRATRSRRHRVSHQSHSTTSSHDTSSKEIIEIMDSDDENIFDDIEVSANHTSRKRRKVIIIDEDEEESINKTATTSASSQDYNMLPLRDRIRHRNLH